ncbi:DHH family phosphoesterase [Haloimpatiens sp. FM7315]|uniref:DHH family phosphoesterase n=1 Tax=Haloimpatiens sp. FM7315 TaxID=3298609 RepID=UPI0035A3A9E5
MNKDKDKFFKNSCVKENFIHKNMKIALNRIVNAVNGREKIIIYGHYDLDCITGVSLLILILRYLNADVEYYIPSEIEDNYEIDQKAVENHIKFLGANLLITVGCGINSCSAVKECQKLGMDVIITDFRLQKTHTPDACIINYAQLQDSYFNNLTSVGLVFKLAREIAKYYKIKCVNKYMDLVMLGTISKNVPLVGENEKYIVEGINKLRVTNNYGIKALMKVHKISNIDVNTIYKLVSTAIPTVNPIGRMDNARIVVELFTTSNAYRAEQIAKYLKKQVESTNHRDLEYKKEVSRLRNFSKTLQLF